MERIHTLIDKLYQQKAQDASPAHLLFTVQLLQQELSQLQSRNGSFNTKKVAVTLPVSFNLTEESLRVPYSESAKEKEVFVLDEVAAEEKMKEEPVIKQTPIATPKEYVLQKPAVAETRFSELASAVKEEPRPAYAQPAYFNTAFDAVAEAPTLPFTERRELHQVIAEKKESLNDRLKEEKTEVAHALKETPIKDLRKAIGINDRFVFLRELFRGDEAMYERSIKTINNFNIYSEAEYWIARELKHILGWQDNNETVKHFYQLVRRRFS
ncbi:hypothetical protein [Flavisolibacter ginsenosidimutans]|uniref:Uncharacterized protein n=1 Tax=Flavisolibacter ginsenosidimutans TaxID=661481 RepID=A0A5B8UHR5_9BACT|nr:hypothetical protein [Flavisolibacter ginsenosidimutans]QEC55620.1 hypothetical protein FSB75_06815 [Flavisolibacter ginsenosidimutans]